MRLASPTLVLACLLALAGCGQPGPEPAVPLTIGAVQGGGPNSRHAGAEVLVEGVVSAVFLDGLDGFFMQSATGEDDGDRRTSDGIFVMRGSTRLAAVEPGQRLQVLGEVVELGPTGASLTALRARRVTELGRGTIEHTVVAAPPESEDFWEHLEGMLVRIQAPLTVTGNAGLLRYGELVVSFDGRLFQPTERAAPGPEADALRARNALHALVLDDGSLAEWPDTVAYLPRQTDADAPLRAGTTLGAVTGIVDRRRGGYRLIPTQPLAVEVQADRPEPPRVDGALRVAALNLENLFNGDGRGGGFPTERGAPTLELFEIQQAKLVATLQALDADIAALSEVENDGRGADSAIVGFVDALNLAGPARDWLAVETEGPGSDAIRVGIIYRSSRVRPIGDALTSDASAFEWGSRPPLAQAFEAGGAEPWLVVSNHFKSKGGCPDENHPRAAAGDADLDDGQACWNAHRMAAATALADWIDSDPAGIGSENTLILGDLNSYAQEDPLRMLADRGWEDALSAAGLEQPYSYVFNGLAGRLDHALMHRSRLDRLQGAAVWHANADEHPGFGYEHDASTAPWRSSDHDPLLLGIDP